MKLWIWNDISEGLTSNYHSGGGAVVIAETRERAESLLRVEAPDLDVSDEDLHPLEPVDAIYDLWGKPDEKVFIFPDAGCC
jgi:hypothetical protein